MTRGVPGTVFSTSSPNMRPSASPIRSPLRRDAASSACFGVVGPARFVKSLAIFCFSLPNGRSDTLTPWQRNLIGGFFLILGFPVRTAEGQSRPPPHVKTPGTPHHLL